ncbi:MAG: hypothetical protein JRI23_03840 [Deltaproteobacteria bacterium]|jgi:hypothetical protein|nr:hypothetical protein [Deltaproteobacteria bacterium]MBW2530660.1 hypothetical protein [Deltaproteobacteria bacterium]
MKNVGAILTVGLFLMVGVTGCGDDECCGVEDCDCHTIGEPCEYGSDCCTGFCSTNMVCGGDCD